MADHRQSKGRGARDNPPNRFEPFYLTPVEGEEADEASSRTRFYVDRFLEGKETIQKSVVPSYRRFLEFMTQEYVPAARKDIAASTLPDGKAFYEHRVRSFTTLDITPIRADESQVIPPDDADVDEESADTMSHVPAGEPLGSFS